MNNPQNNGHSDEPESVPMFPTIEEQSRLLREKANTSLHQTASNGTGAMKPLKTAQIPPEANTASQNEQNEDLEVHLGGYSCDWLMQQDLPETQFIVNSILPVGYSVLGGRPKQGKSISVLGSLALPVAIGGMAFGCYDVRQGTVLLLAYEDTKRRLKERLQRFTQYDEQPPNLAKLRAYHAFPRAHDNGMGYLEMLLDSHTDTRLVVIDTLPRFAPPKQRGESDYDAEYNLGASLYKIAHERQIAIISIVHTTKSSYTNVFDNLRGSGGTAAADVLMVLERTNDKHIRILHSVGRDTEETRLELQSDSHTMLFRSIGEADEERYAELTNYDFKPSITDGEEKKAQAIELNGQGKTLREIAETLSVGKSTIQRWIKSP